MNCKPKSATNGTCPQQNLTTLPSSSIFLYPPELFLTGSEIGLDIMQLRIAAPKRRLQLLGSLLLAMQGAVSSLQLLLCRCQLFLECPVTNGRDHSIHRFYNFSLLEIRSRAYHQTDVTITNYSIGDASCTAVHHPKPHSSTMQYTLSSLPCLRSLLSEAG